mmetsp:Transcript_11124/g.41563  ORF Transcript_11124/g.41563 Transcript_11124/m.41563 type:complete len:207 (+) Transcript_11124:907-1527(+)
MRPWQSSGAHLCSKARTIFTAVSIRTCRQASTLAGGKGGRKSIRGPCMMVAGTVRTTCSACIRRPSAHSTSAREDESGEYLICKTSQDSRTLAPSARCCTTSAKVRSPKRLSPSPSTSQPTSSIAAPRWPMSERLQQCVLAYPALARPIMRSAHPLRVSQFCKVSSMSESPIAAMSSVLRLQSSSFSLRKSGSSASKRRSFCSLPR